MPYEAAWGALPHQHPVVFNCGADIAFCFPEIENQILLLSASPGPIKNKLLRTHPGLRSGRADTLLPARKCCIDIHIGLQNFEGEAYGDRNGKRIICFLKENASWIFILVFIIILVILVSLRTKNSNFEIKTTDIILALFPLVIYLVYTGKITEFSFGDLTFKTAFVEASDSEIKSQIAPLIGLSPRKITMKSKGAVSKIPDLIASKTEGLKFHLGYEGYDGRAIRDYLVALVKYPYLKYLILENEDGTFFGLADARALKSLIEKSSAINKANKLAHWIINANRKSLKTLPGFISQEQAVYNTTDKGQALQRMEELNIDVLPSLNQENKFIGVVDRSRLTASLIIDVTNRLKQK